MPAFRAKLRRLRDLGIPSIERVGSGKRAEYELHHVLELTIACSIADTGISPKHLKGYVDYGLEILRRHRASRQELYAEIMGSTMSEVVGAKELQKRIVNRPKLKFSSILYLSNIEREVRATLA